MHIVQMLPELNQGGVERGVVEINREFIKRGHQSTVISAGGSQAPMIGKDGGTHIQLDVCSKNPLTFLPRVLKLKTQLLKLNPDILHVRSRVPAWLAWYANKKLNIPFVTTVHGFNSVSKYSEIMTKGDAIICVSNPIKRYIQKNYEIKDEKITVIHRGIDQKEFAPEKLDYKYIKNFKKQYNLNKNFIVTTIGRITELKDYETFIRAVTNSATKIPNIKGVIIGGVRYDKKDYFDRLQVLVKKLHAEEKIVFAGSHSNMPEIYALSDVVVSCSKKPESFGRTLIEALAMNTPVIATRHGGALDIIREGETGFLFTPQHFEELTQNICNKIDLRCTDLRADTLERFSLDCMINSILETYQLLHTPPHDSF